MWKIINNNADFSSFNNSPVISRGGMRGYKIKMKQHLRTQMLKTKYAFNSTSNQPTNDAGIDLIIDQNQITNFSIDAKDLQIQNILSAISQRQMPKTSDQEMRNRKRWYKTPRKFQKSLVGQLQTHRKQIKSAKLTQRSPQSSRNQSKSHRQSIFLSENLPHRMNEYLNVLINKKQQDFSKSLRNMEQKSIQINQSPEKSNIMQHHSGRNTFYRKFKVAIKKKNQHYSLKRFQTSERVIPLNDDLSFNQKFQKSQLMKRAQRLSAASQRRPLLNRNVKVLVQNKKRSNSYFLRQKF